MNKYMINFSVEGQILKFLDTRQQIISDTKNFIYFSFVFSDEWASLPKKAIITKGEETVKRNIIDGECAVPSSLLSEKGDLKVSVYSPHNIKITTNEEIVRIFKSGYVEGEFPEPPEPEIGETFVKTMEDETAILFIRNNNGHGEFYNGAEWLPIAEKGDTGEKGDPGDAIIITDTEENKKHETTFKIENNHLVVVFKEIQED